jgi:competence protein ComEC
VARRSGGAGCALAVLAIILGAVGLASYKFGLLWWKKRDAPPPSGKELQVHVLDVGQGDSILIISPGGQAVLIDAGDEKNGKTVVEALRRYGVTKIDCFIATHYHPDHIGGAAEVFNNFEVKRVLENGFPPPEAVEANELDAVATAGKVNDKKKGKNLPAPRIVGKRGKVVELPTVKTYNGLKSAVEQRGVKFEKAELDQTIDIGGGAVLTVLGPVPPPFTKEQIVASRKGNESNANSIVVRLIYGEFSMLLTGDAEEQSEERLVSRGAAIEASVLKVAHHGSKYATSEDFLKHVFRPDNTQPKAAIISDAEFNRYGHPSQDVLGRLKAAGVTQLYRTDLQGEISITTTGGLKDGKLYEIKAAKEAKSDLWTGREGTKDDSSRSGFISYGDFGPPPRPPREKTAKKK